MLNKRSMSSLSETTSYTDRILISRLQGNPSTTIIVIYSPTNSSEDKVIDKFYKELSELIST